MMMVIFNTLKRLQFIVIHNKFLTSFICLCSLLDPPTDVTVTGPSTIEEEEEVSYTCFSAPGNPSAEIEWEVWAANGEPIEFIAGKIFLILAKMILISTIKRMLRMTNK